MVQWHEEQQERLRPGRRIIKQYLKDVGETKRVLGDQWQKVRAAFQTGEMNAEEVCYAIDVGRIAREMQVPVNVTSGPLPDPFATPPSSIGHLVEFVPRTTTAAPATDNAPVTQA